MSIWGSGKFGCNKCRYTFQVEKIEGKQLCPECDSYDLRRLDSVSFSLTGQGWAGRHTSSTERFVSREDRLAQSIETASMTDADIAEVQYGDNKSLQRQMIEKANQLHKEKKHLDRMYDKDLFDGRDNDGNLVKVMDFKPSENGALL